MILGKAGNDKGRKVKPWDYLQVNGKLDVNGDIQMNAGKTFSSPGRMHITGDELLYLLHKKGVIVGKEWKGLGI